MVSYCLLILLTICCTSADSTTLGMVGCCSFRVWLKQPVNTGRHIAIA
jgi:hypothetical protein